MAVTGFEITSRSIAGGGASFGDVGQYEFIVGTLHYAVDPHHPDSQLITDIDLAPTGPDGKVHFSSDLQLLKPVNPKPGGSLLFDVVNRGNKSALNAFSSDPRRSAGADPDLGDGFLMRHGYTVVFCGWQTDVPDGRIRLHVPEALDANGQRLTGQTYQRFNINSPTHELLLSDAGHLPLPTADLGDSTATLMERDWYDGPPTTIPRDQWLFARWVDGRPVPDSNYVCLPSGFQPGKAYEIIYNTVGAPVIGLGFLAMRDCTSFFKYGIAEQGNHCAGTIEQAYAYGASQSGRCLREFIYLGLNVDEEDRPIYAGFIPHIGSSRLGEFNFRFGQPSSNHLRNVGNTRPLPYTEETDPETGQTDGLLRRLEAKGIAPKIIALNSGTEYWWSSASLTHTDPDGTRDVEAPMQVRNYFMAGTKHGSGSLPLTDTVGNDIRLQHFANTLAYQPILRAALVNLDRWVRQGVEPPDSQVPRLSDGTAVSRESLAAFFRSIPGMGFPKALPMRWRLDYGPGMAQGVPYYPPEKGEPYGTVVSAVNSDGNEVAGIRLPDIRVPLGTHTGWSTRHPDIGSADHFVPLQGTVVPFAHTKQDRQSAGDHRASIEERYVSKEDYLSRIRLAAEDMVRECYILAEDVEHIADGASQRWDAFLEVGRLAEAVR